MTLTPMMQQYMDIKDNYKDYILMCRLGDFYEMFFDDAKIVAEELKLTLTARSCGLEEKAPMCGVPHHAVEPYINKLIDLGYKIAICEQVEEPTKIKSIVKREITRLITPGTNQNLDADKADINNYLCGLVQLSGQYAIGFVDITTGSFKVTILDTAMESLDEIKRMRPREIIYNNILSINEINIVGYCKANNISCTELDNSYFDIILCKEQIKKQFNIAFVDGLGLTQDISIALVGSMVRYIFETQKAFLSNISGIDFYQNKDNMMLDSFTIRNLELVETMRECKKQGSLFGILDKTKTAMGARYMRTSILSPSLDKALLLKRYDAIEEFKENLLALDELREYLSSVYDLERITSKLVNGSANPRDMLALGQSFEIIEPIKMLLGDFKSKYIVDIKNDIDSLSDIKKLIYDSIDAEAGISIRDGGIIKSGYNNEIDDYREAAVNGKDWIIELEAREKEETGIRNLRVKYSKNFGYCIEINRNFADKVPEKYIRRQTLTNAERYTFEELKNIENKIIGSEEKLYKLELEIFTKIREEVLKSLNRILKTAHLLAELDYIQSLSYIAYKNNYSRPILTDDGVLNIEDGRHPVVELMLNTNEFIPNDVYLDLKKERFAIITGPNMSGKSTYMRQTALICIMAQIGSFVPCKQCKMGLIDKIFTRVGASDDLATGQSTFMVEMTEVANILHNATPKSLLILDEIGRGTSTFDGLSLAWAIVEYIADKDIIGAKTLFATHYHELTELEGKIDNVVNYFIDVYEKNDNVIFLRKILRGGANRSYGIQVAKLAGVPNAVITRAKELSLELEKTDIALNINTKFEKNKQITMFDIYDFEEDDSEKNKIIQELKELVLETMTPIELMNYIVAVKKRLRDVN